MKIDVEGTEIDIAPDLLLTGALNSVDVVTIEWHHWMASPERKIASEGWAEVFRRLSELLAADNSDDGAEYRRTRIVTSDDETYYKSNFTLPSCE